MSLTVTVTVPMILLALGLVLRIGLGGGRWNGVDRRRGCGALLRIGSPPLVVPLRLPVLALALVRIAAGLRLRARRLGGGRNRRRRRIRGELSRFRGGRGWLQRGATGGGRLQRGPRYRDGAATCLVTNNTGRRNNRRPD